MEKVYVTRASRVLIVFDHLLGIPQGDPQSILIVVSPLTAIIEDQVRSFTARGLAVAGVTNSTVQEVKEGVARGDYSLVYFTPELVGIGERFF
ncbi:hypothetical protein EMCRGX_G021230 [Ephydatia muelleri]